MSEYVEKQALDDAFASLIPWAIANEIDAAYEQGLCAAHNSLLGFPAADVAPVVHSYWIPVCGYRKDNPCGGVLCRCGNCNEVTLIPDKGALYCSQCGAKMDMETP